MKRGIVITMAFVLLVPISAIANASEPTYLAFEKPLKQIMHGTLPKDVSCNNDLVLILKHSDGSPACVKSSTAHKLVERVWGQDPHVSNP